MTEHIHVGVEITLGGGKPGVAQLILDSFDIGPAVQEVGAVGVPRLMGREDGHLILRLQGAVEIPEDGAVAVGKLGRGEKILTFNAGEDIGADMRQRVEYLLAGETERHSALLLAFR